MKNQGILHYPRLDTVLMVENTIKNADDYPTKTQLWKALPKKMMYQTFCLIVDYLIETGKIIIDSKDNKIIWIWDPDGIKKMEEKGLIIKWKKKEK